MEAVLKFQFPEDKNKFEITMRAMALYCSMLEIQRICRDHTKYDRAPEECVIEIIDEIRELNLDDLG